MPPPTQPARIVVTDLAPRVDCGCAPARAVRDEPLDVAATVVRDGHVKIRVGARFRGPGERRCQLVPMHEVEEDRYRATIVPERLGRYEIWIEAAVAPFASWRDELDRKLAAGQTDLTSELAEGAALVAELATTLRGQAAKRVAAAAAAIADGPAEERLVAARDAELVALLDVPAAWREPARGEPLVIDVDPPVARAGAWYELFPRSFGGFAGVRAQLPRLADLGFDVVYLTPIHPIGTTKRKGRNNVETAAPGEPGSPWAIGSTEGGHTAVHPDLGTQTEFEDLVGAARELGLEIAMDFAIQCSPDHPWLAEHPEWFHRRPDGTIKYAENPPKRYQDIYNVDFACADWRGLWTALAGVVRFWVERGVRIFRVDNPHTKPLAFWRWLIDDIRAEHPETVFLAEAFTRPALMHAVAASGFSQSYTYFTWKNSKAELVGLMDLVNSPDWRDVYRPNFFVNTPDILHEYLQTGGRPAFEARLLLAATLSPSYGMYSGFEDLEAEPVAPGSEEYRDSEKYEVKRRTLDGPLLPLVAAVNAARRAHPALLRPEPFRFLESANDEIVAFAKGQGADAVIVCVNISPQTPVEGLIDVPAGLGLPASFTLRDALDGEVYNWGAGGNYVALVPGVRQGHVLTPAE